VTQIRGHGRDIANFSHVTFGEGHDSRRELFFCLKCRTAEHVQKRIYVILSPPIGIIRVAITAYVITNLVSFL